MRFDSRTTHAAATATAVATATTTSTGAAAAAVAVVAVVAIARGVFVAFFKVRMAAKQEEALQLCMVPL